MKLIISSLAGFQFYIICSAWFALSSIQENVHEPGSPKGEQLSSAPASSNPSFPCQDCMKLGLDIG